MKIRDGDRFKGAPYTAKLGATGGTEPRAPAGPATAPAAPPTDTAVIGGIPENQLTPKVRKAILALMAEVERLRRELATNQARITYLEELADQDFLVPAVNRRAFVLALSRAMSYADRYGTPGSLIYFDINGMKAINDGLGHGAGDAALVQVAQTLLDNVRDSDTVGRLGGDEFGVLLLNTDERAALEKGADLARAISASECEWRGGRVPLSAAFGTCTFRGERDAIAVMSAADQDMYRRKSEERGPAD